MKRAKWTCAAGLLLLAVLARLPGGRAQPDKLGDVAADERIQTISVKIDVGADAADLDEPVALDLGLGFPLWLHPLGRPDGTAVPAGAVPQETDAKTTIAAGASGSFTFRLEGEAGQDQLRTTPRLLTGVRVADIGRVGFAGLGRSNWILAGYEIRINGKLFASSNTPHADGDAAIAKARTRLVDLDKTIATLREELAELDKRGAAGKATGADRERFQKAQAELAAAVTEGSALRIRYRLNPRAAAAQAAAGMRLADLEAELAKLRKEAALDGDAAPAPPNPRLAALLAEKRRLEGQLEGKYPWFEDSTFVRPAATVEKARVIVETWDHAGADSKNRVYFAAGGHRYFLNGAGEPLTAAGGPQEFWLDLIAGPLRPADLRGWGLGMLAHPGLQGAAPDRWHPRRLLVEIDGRVIYDSEDAVLDRRSLQAIRLIPRAQRGAAEDQLVLNKATARQLYFWEAGKGLGLDADTGSVVPLPPRGDTDSPQPEPGLSGDGAAPPDVDNFPPDFDPFPGEPFPPPWAPLPPDDPGWQPPPPDPLPPGVDPPPAGPPFQVDSAEITMGWKAGDSFKIEWKVSGDESGIDHYEVSLIAVRPDQANVYAEQLLQATVGKDQRSYVGAVGPAAPGVGPYYFVAPMVVAVPTDPTAKTTAHERIGPARAFFPADADALRQPVPVKFVFDNAAGTHGEGAFGATIVPGTARGAWTLEAVDGHNAILFGSPRPGLHVGYRPEPGDTITGHFTAADIKGPQRLLCHLGFEGAGGSNTMNVTVFVSLKNAAGQLYNYPKTEIANVDAAGPMKLLDFKLDPADVGGAGPYTLILGIGVKGGAIDPAHPPGLFGLRLLPGSSGGPAAPTIKADLAIGDKYLIPGRGRDAKVSIMPFVEVKNLGPDDIPASLVSKIRVQTRYFVGQYGDTVADTQKVVWCVNPLKSSGPLPVGGKAVIMPTHPVELPTGVFTTWTKLLGVRVEILLPLTGEVADPNLANNKYDKMYLPPIVLGDGVGPYEVILYDQKWFKGRSVSYEYKPTLRHKLIPDLGDMNRQASSMKVGDKVRVAVFSEPNFGGWDRQVAGGYLRHSVWRPGPENLPLLGSWHPIPGFPSIGRSYDKALCSLIIMPEAQQYPSGVLLVDSSVWAFDTERFFPLPEDPKVYNVEFHSLGPGNGAVNGCADLIQAFGGTYGVTLYEQPGYQGQSYTFMALSSDQFVVDLNSVGFEDRAWSMKIGAWIPVKP